MSDQTVGLTGNGADTTKKTTTTQATAATTEKKRGTVTSDPKLVSCIKISRALDALTTADRAFVLAYIADKYKV